MTDRQTDETSEATSRTRAPSGALVENMFVKRARVKRIVLLVSPAGDDSTSQESVLCIFFILYSALHSTYLGPETLNGPKLNFIFSTQNPTHTV